MQIRLIVFLLLVAALLLHRLISAHRKPLPPGPTPIPIIGNIQEMIKKEPLQCFKDWHQQYGPLVTLRYGSRLIISVSSFDMARELFEKRGAIYSSRPRFIVASERMSGSMNLALLPHNKRWQDHRRVIARLLDPAMTRRYTPIQDLESTQVLYELLLDDGVHFHKVIARFAASLMLTLAYGIYIPENDSPVPDELERLNSYPFKAIGDIYCVLVELFPFLDHAPQWVAPWKKLASSANREITDLFMGHLEAAKVAPSWNWVKDARQSETGRHMPDEEIAGIIGAIQQTAVEALSIVTRLTIKALVLNPECVARAQEELDRVVGPDRIPSAADLPRLPYINAIVNEAMRWQPPSPIALPHVNTEEDEYMGYRIPKGTSLIPNLWVMGTNFPNPEQYRPERWLEDSQTATEGLDHSPFGFGRRLCPGRHVAFSSIATVIAQMLWGYNFSHRYRDGKKVEVDAWDLILTAVVNSAPYEASFQVRSPKHQEIIDREWTVNRERRDQILNELKPPAQGHD
ncbi:cytochrome P450 [Aspergillus karnatakaensis]|uniref:cytochrome P450 n=1 Tax=Aspergillus karnatakaensis TaxID=1810916 RepID=UPI003CCE1A04